MNRKRTTLWILFAAIALAGAGAVVAGAGRSHDGDGCGHGPMAGLHRVLSQLDLTEAQKTSIKDILHGERSSLEPLRQAAAQTRRELFEAVHATSFDEGAVRAAADRAGKAQSELAVARARMVSKVRAVLTPAQQEMVDGLRDRALERMEQRGKRGGRIWREHADEFIDSL